MFVALSLGDASRLRNSHAGGVALANSGARRAVDTFHKAPLEGSLPVHEPALGVEAAEALCEGQLVLVIPLNRDVKGLDQSNH